VEHKPGALQALQKYLNTSAYRTKATLVESHGRTPPDNHASRTLGESSTQIDTSGPGDIADEPLQGDISSSMDSYDQANTDISLDPMQTLHLFSCTDKGSNEWQLHQEVITNVQNDRQLFNGLRQQYRKHRSVLRPLWSFRTLQSIHFMKVNFHTEPNKTAASLFSHNAIEFTYGAGSYVDMRCHDELCERGRPCECIPPETRVIPQGNEYRCHPSPPGRSPPFGPNLLMSYFADPSKLTPKGKAVLDQLPKKIGGEFSTSSQPAAVAWGIYKEDWDWVRIGIVLFGFALSSGLFGIIWTVVKNDIQGGFTISSWWMTVGASLVSLVALSAPPF
jgi:hypothetical protein